MYGGLCLYFMNSWERTGSQLTHTHTRTNRQCRRADAKNPHCLLCFVVWPLDTVCSYYVDPMQMLQNCINSNQFLINVSALWIRNYIFEGRLRILIWTIFRFLDYQKYIFDNVLFFFWWVFIVALKCRFFCKYWLTVVIVWFIRKNAIFSAVEYL